MASNTIELVSFISKDEPAALGCTAAMSPDLPIPWLNLLTDHNAISKNSVTIRQP